MRKHARTSKNSHRQVGPGVRVVVGTGDASIDDWYCTDKDLLDVTKPSDWKSLFSSSSINAILAEHVWEHLTHAEAMDASFSAYNFLRQGGYLRLAVPDGLHPAWTYIDWVRPGGVGPGAEDHKVLYTYRTLSAQLAHAGFEVRLLEYFDEYGRFHRRPWRVEDGPVRRSFKFDSRNGSGKPTYTSIILDAFK